jgi:hypothetical protein
MRGESTQYDPADHDVDPVEGLVPLVRPMRELVPSQYIVYINDGVEHLSGAAHGRPVWAAAKRARELGITVRHEFTLIRAFGAIMNPEQLEQMRQDPDVAYVEQDGVYDMY